MYGILKIPWRKVRPGDRVLFRPGGAALVAAVERIHRSFGRATVRVWYVDGGVADYPSRGAVRVERAKVSSEPLPPTEAEGRLDEVSRELGTGEAG